MINQFRVFLTNTIRANSRINKSVSFRVFGTYYIKAETRLKG